MEFDPNLSAHFVMHVHETALSHDPESSERFDLLTEMVQHAQADDVFQQLFDDRSVEFYELNTELLAAVHDVFPPESLSPTVYGCCLDAAGRRREAERAHREAIPDDHPVSVYHDTLPAEVLDKIFDHLPDLTLQSLTQQATPKGREKLRLLGTAATSYRESPRGKIKAGAAPDVWRQADKQFLEWSGYRLAADYVEASINANRYVSTYFGRLCERSNSGPIVKPDCLASAPTSKSLFKRTRRAAAQRDLDRRTAIARSCPGAAFGQSLSNLFVDVTVWSNDDLLAQGLKQDPSVLKSRFEAAAKRNLGAFRMAAWALKFSAQAERYVDEVDPTPLYEEIIEAHAKLIGGYRRFVSGKYKMENSLFSQRLKAAAEGTSALPAEQRNASAGGLSGPGSGHESTRESDDSSSSSDDSSESSSSSYESSSSSD